MYTARRVYPFHKANFRLKGDFWGAPGWGPIPEDQPTLAEMLSEAGYRTALVADVYHMFKPSKNFWRGFSQWTFLRGQEMDRYLSGPKLSREQLDHWLPKKMQNKRTIEFVEQCVLNIHNRHHEEDFFSPKVFREAAKWLEENNDAKKFYLLVESFDPHEPWLVPAHYRNMYLKDNGQDQIKSAYANTSKLENYLLRRTQANYSGSVTQCDRWFGFFIEQLRVMDLLDKSLVIVTSDHGHSIGDGNYMGKRAYPSRPEVFDTPLMIRFPKAKYAGKTSTMFVQHHDIAAEILKQARVKPPASPVKGEPFLSRAVSGKPGLRDHVTIGWSSTPTVITDRWWFNCKCDGSGMLLYDLKARKSFTKNVANKYHKVARRLFEQALADAGGSFPDWLIEMAQKQADAPGCSDLAARK